MIIGGNNKAPSKVSGLKDDERIAIHNYLQGMVYGWCARENTEPGAGTKPFAAHHLVGGVNWHWEGTPLQCVYNKQKTDAETAYTVAAQEVGRLLKKVIFEDKRGFSCTKEGRVVIYTWDGEYPPRT